ncbi:hypothetical protein D623_10002844 [Myotis brandtii]|uniref:Uncharacterized protein n=1 Tax=Myotis brandtii TaxID=109478 RepID=S7MJ12_MYOBR|nr:hypothetical protein D623_10002844 [Myotis brandtii]
MVKIGCFHAVCFAASSPQLLTLCYFIHMVCSADVLMGREHGFSQSCQEHPTASRSSTPSPRNAFNNPLLTNELQNPLRLLLKSVSQRSKTMRKRGLLGGEREAQGLTQRLCGITGANALDCGTGVLAEDTEVIAQLPENRASPRRPCPGRLRTLAQPGPSRALELAVCTGVGSAEHRHLD